MKRLLLIALLCMTPAFADANKEGMPVAGVPGWPPRFGFCMAVKGVSALTCLYGDMGLVSADLLKAVIRSGLPTIAALGGDPRIAEAAPGVIFPELGDPWDSKAAGYCYCAADSQGVDTGGSPFEKPTNSGKGGCTYWMVCYIKGVPGSNNVSGHHRQRHVVEIVRPQG